MWMSARRSLEGEGGETGPYRARVRARKILGDWPYPPPGPAPEGCDQGSAFMRDLLRSLTGVDPWANEVTLSGETTYETSPYPASAFTRSVHSEETQMKYLLLAASLLAAFVLASTASAKNLGSSYKAASTARLCFYSKAGIYYGFSGSAATLANCERFHSIMGGVRADSHTQVPIRCALGALSNATVFAVFSYDKLTGRVFCVMVGQYIPKSGWVKMIG
jgi:hypothetical protein